MSSTATAAADVKVELNFRQCYQIFRDFMQNEFADKKILEELQSNQPQIELAILTIQKKFNEFEYTNSLEFAADMRHLLKIYPSPDAQVAFERHFVNVMDNGAEHIPGTQTLAARSENPKSKQAPANALRRKTLSKRRRKRVRIVPKYFKANACGSESDEELGEQMPKEEMNELMHSIKKIVPAKVKKLIEILVDEKEKFTFINEDKAVIDFVHLKLTTLQKIQKLMNPQRRLKRIVNKEKGSLMTYKKCSRNGRDPDSDTSSDSSTSSSSESSTFLDNVSSPGSTTDPT